MPKLSIIIAAYNVEKYIEGCISSIYSQTFNDWEVVICDDCSTDNTLTILRELASRDSRVKVLNNSSNMKSGPTRNKCIENSNGEYIAIQDADDFSDENRFKLQVNFLDSHSEYSIVGCNSFLFDDSETWGERKMSVSPGKTDFIWGIPFIHPTVMMRKDELLKVGGYRQSKETRRAEDYDLFVRMYAAGMKGYNLQESLYFYREDRDAYRKRKYTYRIDEAILRYKSFKSLGLLPKGIPYIIKPLIVGLIPAKAMMKYRAIKDRRPMNKENQ